MSTDAQASASIFSLIPIAILIGVLILLIPWSKKCKKDRKEKQKNGELKKLNPVFKVLCTLGCIIDFVLYGFITDWSFSPSDSIVIIIVMIIPGILTQCLYFLPYLFANSKCHPQETAIFVLNLFAGWTVIAWIICLVWTFTTKKDEKVITAVNSNAKQIEEFKDLLDKGIITQEEFNEKKRQLLQ